MIEGRVKIGLVPSELARLADTKRNPSVVKLSRRDLGPAVSKKADGGTTCSATLMFASLVGIKVFATGGLGGVHRGAENSMDVSADLVELSRNPVGLVSAGVKSILDIGRTLEYLETLGVPVVSYGQTTDFPAFFSPKSGYKVSWNVDNPFSAAEILYAQEQFGMKNGTLIAVPIPQQFEEEGFEIQKAVDQAVEESERNDIAKLGKEVTPWLLNRVSELTQGRSQQSNIALLRNTAQVGGCIAVEYAKMAWDYSGNEQASSSVSRSNESTVYLKGQSNLRRKTSKPKISPKLVIIGSSAVDVTARGSEETASAVAVQSTVSGKISLSVGGVARNIAEASHRVSGNEDSVMLLSPIADDMFGDFLRRETAAMGMRDDGLLVQPDHRTASCSMILDRNGHLVTGIADMDIVKEFTSQAVAYVHALVVAVANEPTLGDRIFGSTPSKYCCLGRQFVSSCGDKYSSTLPEGKHSSEPTSVLKSTTILQVVAETFNDTARPPISYITPNILELAQIYNGARETYDLFSRESWWKAIDDFSVGSGFRTELEHLSRAKLPNEASSTMAFLIRDGIAQMALNLFPFFEHLIIKCGSAGVIVFMRTSGESEWTKQASTVNERCIVSHGAKGSVVVAHFSALPATVVNVTGAGDSLVGALLSRLAERPNAFANFRHLKETIDFAQQAAVLTLASELAVSPSLSELRM
ncbi:hypothetical protein E1B28_000973 [Marasmius oreades]|uniref:Carbohydrate kinase PfkB domain-containing protein n=1 Tax=Marasmius oreades TaxID=181124 RepID=A0A9P7V2G6_9AGAR|nr:uncharacterized protein E1B28_000973 [Marasmius oreades]KAG7099099.1 hypothetical protein E1B28_000973 [Marasmius oreades]